MTRTHYEILGVPQNSSFETLKVTYRKLALRLHPDKNKSSKATALFQQLNLAWEVLKDAKTRASYDENLGRSGPTASPTTQTDAWDELRAHAERAQFERARHQQKQAENDWKLQQLWMEEQRKKAEREWQRCDGKQGCKIHVEGLNQQSAARKDRSQQQEVYDWKKHAIIEKWMLESLAEFFSADMPHLKRDGLWFLIEQLYRACMIEEAAATKKSASDKKEREKYEKKAAAKKEDEAVKSGSKAAQSKTKPVPEPENTPPPRTDGKYRADDDTFKVSLQADYEELEKQIWSIEDVIRMLEEDSEYFVWASMELMQFLGHKSCIRLKFDLQLKAKERLCHWKKVMSNTRRDLETKLELIIDELVYFEKKESGI
jgi:curved DNA-binding protein CbpA